MKLLKIVLITLVTVGIYSFTTNPVSKKEEVNYKKEISYQTSTTCVTFTFKRGLTNEQKQEARMDFQRNQGISLLGIISTSGDSETWTYFNRVQIVLPDSGGGITSPTETNVVQDPDDMEFIENPMINFNYHNCNLF